MNTNGIISLDNWFTAYFAEPFPLNDTVKVIAPYWADVDTTGTGQIFYRQSTDPSLLARASSDIKAAYPLLQNDVITHLFIATWDAVGSYYGGTDQVYYVGCCG